MKLSAKWKKILLLTPLFGLFSFTEGLSEIIGNVLFVEQFGAESLPYVYILESLLVALLAFGVSFLLKKSNPVRLLQIFSIFGAIIFAGLFLLIQYGYPFAYAIFLVISSALFLIITGTAVWLVASTLSTLYESKSEFVYYSLAASLGGVIAGIITFDLSSSLNLSSLILVVCAGMILAIIDLLIIQKLFGEKLQDSITEKGKSSKWEDIKKAIKEFGMSRLARRLFLVMTLFNIVWWISDFEYQTILSSALSQAEYAKMFSILKIVNNAAIVVMLFFVQNWIIKSKGVVNTLFLSPVLVFFAFLALYLLPTPMVALASNAITMLIGYSTFNNSSRFVFTALPHTIRNNVATLISGNSDAIATLIAGGGLVVLTHLVDNNLIILTGCVLLIIAICGAWSLKKEYTDQIVHNLNNGDEVDMHCAIENLAEPAYKKMGVKELMKFLQWHNSSTETVRKVVFALGKIDNIKVIPALLELIKKHDETVKYSVIEAIQNFSNLNKRLSKYPFTRMNIIEDYEKIFLEEQDSGLKTFILDNLRDFGEEKAIMFIKRAIKDHNPKVRQKALSAMRYFHDRGIGTYVKPYLKDSNPQIRAAAVIALWQFMELRPQLIKNINEIMSGQEKLSILASLNMIGILNFEWEKEYVKPHLQSQDDEVRRKAVITMMLLNDRSIVNTVVETLIGIDDDGVYYARALKQINPKLRDKILLEARKMGKQAAENCIQSLKDSYLNFSDEIEDLRAKQQRIHQSKTLGLPFEETA